MTAPQFKTITADDWKRALAVARERRAGAPERLAQAVRKHKTRTRLTWSQSEARAEKVFRLYRTGMTHEKIGDELGLDRSLVTYYLSPRCKASIRAGCRRFAKTADRSADCEAPDGEYYGTDEDCEACHNGL